MERAFDIIVGGHLCLDLIPGMDHVAAESLAVGGGLTETKDLALSTGGAVSNTGMALHQLGAHVGLMASVGNDLLGNMVVSFLAGRHPGLELLIKRREGHGTSYSVVLAPKGRDRSFLHFPGANAAFGEEDVDQRTVSLAKIFHLGYPPIMPRLIAKNGAELQSIYAQAKASGVVTSMDMVVPDPSGPSGHADWLAILKNVLPSVDVFLPSIDEALFMLRRADYDAWRGDVLPHLTREYLFTLAGELLAMGVVVAGFKLGEMGLYLRTAAATAMRRLARLPVDASDWTEREYWQGAFEVQVAGTTGAGDAAYAGFLAAMLRGMPPQACLQWASAVGACNVEAVDAVSGVRRWDETAARIEAGWRERDSRLPGYLH